MSDPIVIGLIASYGVMAILLIIDEVRHRYYQPPWACARCGHGPLEANGPASIFDGRHGFTCPRCGHQMQAYRSRIVLSLLFVICLCITAGCLVIVLLYWNPAELGLSDHKPFIWMIVGLAAGPIGAFLCVYLMRQPMPVRLQRKVEPLS